MSLRITFLRHGNTVKTAGDHRTHVLSDTGRAQAMARREQLGNPQFDLICHSGLARTEETARIVAGLAAEEPTVEVDGLFYDAAFPGAQALDAAFKKLGYATLDAYYREGPGVSGPIATLACIAAERIDELIESDAPTRMLVVGHAVLLPASCLAFTEGADEVEKRIFLEANIGECEGFQINMIRRGRLLVTSIR
ncbi:MAG: histidine phosphatase family protein [Patescibacteria group bacterium]